MELVHDLENSEENEYYGEDEDSNGRCVHSKKEGGVGFWGVKIIGSLDEGWI